MDAIFCELAVISLFDMTTNSSKILYLLVLETLNTAFNIGLVYEPLVHNFGE